MMNQNLQNAKIAKKDDFFTQLSDIENELKYYQQHFLDKVIYCNCDNPKLSNFFLYFAKNFWNFKLKKLICAFYSLNNKGSYFEYNGCDENGKKLCENMEIQNFIANIQSIKFKDNGDFRSLESVALLKKADIVVTNPPFSLFREYVAQLIEYNKKFVIIGPLHARTYKDFFVYIQKNKVWNGYTTPKLFIDIQTNTKKQFGNICWYTNLDIQKRHNFLKTIYSYFKTPEKYPKYDNFDAININRIAEIPLDYDGVMGVPLTFLDKYNPDQFEILGNEIDLNIPKGRGYIDGKRLYARIFIKRK